MTINSMTGFARAEGSFADHSWVWEVRSVNAKGLDLRFRPPSGFEILDPMVRKQIADRFKRGSISVNLTVRREGGGVSYQINEEFLTQLVARLKQLQDEMPGAAPPRADGIMALRGVIEPIDTMIGEEQFEQVAEAMLADLKSALSEMAGMRADEGNRLDAVLSEQIEQVGILITGAASIAAAQPDAIRARLNEQIARIMADHPTMPEERLAQEAAMLMTKADIQEELDRLRAHVAAARDLLKKSDSPVGRRMDFLCQEFNREANTLCSKSSDTALTTIGLDLKTVIEQLREQVQNIE